MLLLAGGRVSDTEKGVVDGPGDSVDGGNDVEEKKDEEDEFKVVIHN